MFQTFDRIKELAKKQGLSINSLEEKLGYSRNTEIADYFNVSTDYLLGRTDNPVIAGDKAKTEIDLKKDAAESFFYDGHELNDEDLDLISSLLEARMRNRK